MCGAEAHHPAFVWIVRIEEYINTTIRYNTIRKWRNQFARGSQLPIAIDEWRELWRGSKLVICDFLWQTHGGLYRSKQLSESNPTHIRHLFSLEIINKCKTVFYPLVYHRFFDKTESLVY